MSASIKKLEEDLSFSDDSNENPPQDVIAFNELRSCADILRLSQSGQLETQPDFQRGIVWSNSDQTKFVDSLTKQLPIPSMCFSLDSSDDSRIVIDGLQRISTIIKFLSEDDWTLSTLEDVDPRLSGKTVSEIKTENPSLYAKVENLMIPITVIRCSYSDELHMEYLYTIFHRLNSGGSKLNNQEIRNCIYTGSFNTLLKELAMQYSDEGILSNDKRFKNEEYILRFYAFRDNLDGYNGKLSKFLNNYMFEHRTIEQEELQALRSTFADTVELIEEKIIPVQGPLKKLSRTVLEGLLFGISSNLEYLQGISSADLNSKYLMYIALEEFSQANLKEGLSSRRSVVGRLTAAKSIFQAT